MASRVFVTVSIYDSSCTRTLLDWTISDVPDERVTVAAFYKMAMCGRTAIQHVKHCIEEAKVGKTRDTLTRIGNTGTYMECFGDATALAGMNLMALVSCFGPAVRYYIKRRRLSRDSLREMLLA